MTPAEAAEIAKARPDLLHTLRVYQHPDPRFVFLRGQPCPLLTWDGALAVCSVWAVRPYNCRRFGCFRPDSKAETYECETLDPERGHLGCANLSDRLQHRGVRRQLARMQRKAQKWALKHGWSQDMTPPVVGSNVTFYRLSPAVHPPGHTPSPAQTS